jgi:hypothetical protein
MASPRRRRRRRAIREVRSGLGAATVTEWRSQMTSPIIYIGAYKMKAGMLEGYRRDFMPELLRVGKVPDRGSRRFSARDPPTARPASPANGSPTNAPQDD